MMHEKSRGGSSGFNGEKFSKCSIHGRGDFFGTDDRRLLLFDGTHMSMEFSDVSAVSFLLVSSFKTNGNNLKSFEQA